MKLKYLSLFSGIGAFEKSFDRLGIDFDLVGFSEIDKYAVKSYCAIHNVDESLNLGDITKIDAKALPKDIDLITYGFPCQDISLAGKQQGLFHDDGTQTRSGLFFEALRIIEETKPRVAIAENVKNLTSKKFSEQFKIVLNSLEAAGYNNYWQVLNAKNFGIPQNRERVFIVSIRKDIDTEMFQFPEGFPLELRLKDMLEDEVDEKYYLSSQAIGRLVRHKNRIIENDTPDASCTIHASYFKGGGRDQQYIKEPSVKQIANLMPSKTRENPNQGRLYDTEGLCPTLGAMQGGNRQPFVMVNSDSVKVREATKQGYAEAVEGDSINLEQPNSKTRRGRVGHQVAQTLTSTSAGNEKILIDKPEVILRIRKLTPKECFRLMNFDDEDFAKAEAANSNTQLYKQAGNSIVVAVSTAIIKALIEANIFIESEEKDMELKVQKPTFPEVIEFNFDELKQEITNRASYYVNLVYTDSQIPDAKKDRAALNKFAKALSDERIKIKKECLKPYEDFEKKIKELDGIVSTAIKNIDDQVKAHEENEKAKKLDIIKKYWQSCTPPFPIEFEKIFNEKWLNATVSMKTIETEIELKIKQIESDIITIAKLPEFAFEAMEEYRQTLDLATAISEGQRLAEIQKRKAEAEERARAEAQKQHEEVVVEQPTSNDEEDNRAWVGFKANLTKADAQQLAGFFAVRGIEYEAIEI